MSNYNNSDLRSTPTTTTSTTVQAEMLGYSPGLRTRPRPLYSNFGPYGSSYRTNENQIERVSSYCSSCNLVPEDQEEYWGGQRGLEEWRRIRLDRGGWSQHEIEDRKSSLREGINYYEEALIRGRGEWAKGRGTKENWDRIREHYERKIKRFRDRLREVNREFR